jgi:hypothetical protein
MFYPKFTRFSSIEVGQGEGTSSSNGNLYFGVAFKASIFFCDGPIKMAHCNQKRIFFGKHCPPSHELKHEYTIHINATYFTSLWMKPRMKPQSLP